MAEKTFTPDEEAHLRETLKRCSATTYIAAREFRATGNLHLVPTILQGVIERHVERNLRVKLQEPADDLRLAEDLGLDSLSLMEIVILAEDVLRITIDNDELRSLRTLGDVVRFVDHKLGLAAAGPPLRPDEIGSKLA